MLHLVSGLQVLDPDDARLADLGVQADSILTLVVSTLREEERTAILASLRQGGQVLANVANQFKALFANREFICAAVRQDWRALEYAAPALKADCDVILAAVQRDWRALQYAAEAPKADRRVVLAALRK